MFTPQRAANAVRRLLHPDVSEAELGTHARRYHTVTLALLALAIPLELYLAWRLPIPGLALLLATCAALLAAERARELSWRERQIAIESEVERQADALLRDGQTGLPNRNYLIDQLSREIARAERYGTTITLAVIELARVDELQRSWGGDILDRAAAHVAETLRRVTRASDFLARLDEQRFAVVLLECTREQAVRFADRITLAVANRPLEPAGRQRVPVYVAVQARATQFERERFRGPLELISAAGGDVASEPPSSRAGGPGAVRAITRRAPGAYHSGATPPRCADAWREYRARRRLG